MSAPLGHTDVMFRQRVLACSSFYTGRIDGSWGPKTDKADYDFSAESLRLKAIGGEFDPRTENVILSLLIQAQAKAREFMKIAGPTCKLLSGTRTYAEQDILYHKRPVVTRARGGHSNHNFGIAWDVGIFKNGCYLTGATHAEEAAYDALAVNIKANVQGLEWGGDWKSIVDKPHYQLVTGKTLAEVRASFEAGKPFV